MLRVYRRADLIVAVTPTALEQIAGRGIPRRRLELARNAAEETPAIERPAKNGAPFTVIYAGNLGLATDVDLLLEAASHLKDAGIRLEIAGGGALANDVRERVTRENLTNVRFSGVLTRLEALRHIAAADVAIVPLRAGITESIPTKLYDALSVGCPVIVAAGGEAACEGAALGAICTPAGDAHAVAAAIRALSRLDPDELREMGRRSQAAVRQRSGRAAIMTRLSTKIASL
jgi:glycosyltransferase involved in cell wall biosynthesis